MNFSVSEGAFNSTHSLIHFTNETCWILVRLIVLAVGSEASLRRVRRGSVLVISTRATHQSSMASLRALDPILFLLYTADVLVIVGRYGVSAHSYADDTQLYIHSSTDSCSMMFRHLTACINEIGSCMSPNRLKLNSEETQFTCLSSRYQLAKVDTTSFLIIRTSIYSVSSPAS